MSHLLAERDNAWLLAADRAVVASPERGVNNTAFPGLQEGSPLKSAHRRRRYVTRCAPNATRETDAHRRHHRAADSRIEPPRCTSGVKRLQTMQRSSQAMY